MTKTGNRTADGADNADWKRAFGPAPFPRQAGVIKVTQSYARERAFFSSEPQAVSGLKPKPEQEPIRLAPKILLPLADRALIVAEVERRLSVVEELESVVSANLQCAARLRQAILQRGFSGEL